MFVRYLWLQASASVGQAVARRAGLAIIVMWAMTSAGVFGPAAPNDWAEGLPGHEDGATRDYYNRAALLAWKNLLGDWRDRLNQPQGQTPYSVVEVRDEDRMQTVAWDVTDLVSEWVAGRYPNQGFFLRCVSGKGAVVFASREAVDEPLRPQLILEGTTGVYTLVPIADTYITPSTYRSLGHLNALRVSAQPENALLRFALDPMQIGQHVGRIKSATLRLVSVAQFGDCSVGVFRCWQGHDPAPQERQWGLAARYPGDRGLEQNAAVWFTANFESEDWHRDWSSVAPRGRLELVSSDSALAFVPLQGKALRVHIAQGENTAMNTLLRLRSVRGSEPDALYFRYYLRLADDWNQTVSDGKLPGFSGTYGIAGWGGRRSDGSNGWSARGLFRRTIPAGNPLVGTTPIGFYCYHADMSGDYGEHWVWQVGHRGFLHKNRWYCIEQFVRLNTPGERNGVLRGWVDGFLAFEKTDIRFRAVDRLLIEQLWMNVYHGGTQPSPHDQHCYIDNVVVADQYIGPMVVEE